MIDDLLLILDGEMDVTPICSPSASHLSYYMSTPSETLSNVKRNISSLTPTPTSDTAAQTSLSLKSPDKNQFVRITRQSLKKINEVLLTPIKTPLRISKRRQTVDTRASKINSNILTRRKTIDVNQFVNENGQRQTFKLNFPAYMNLAPLIYRQEKKLPPPPPGKSKDTSTKANKTEVPKSSRRVSNVLKNLENAGVQSQQSTSKHKGAIQKSKRKERLVNNNRIINKPYKCSVCDKSYRNSFDLISHMSHHTGEPAYRCNMCEYHCLNIKTIKKHANKVHNSVFQFVNE